MRINIVHCDCCKKPAKEETNSGIQGILLLSEIPALDQPPEEVEIDLEDLCDSCAIGLNEVISDFLARNNNG